MKTKNGKKSTFDPRRLPRRVNVMGLTFPITVRELAPDEHEEKVFGESHGPNRTIELHKFQSLEQAQHTLFHECVHMALYASGLSELISDNMEEALVVAIENAFAHAIDLSALAEEEDA